MNTAQEKNTHGIYDAMTQLQSDLEGILKSIFEQAGNRIELEKQEAVQREMAGTKQLLERFKGHYA